jgi:hypothetical protein
MRSKYLLRVFAMGAILFLGSSAWADSLDYRRSIQGIARGIEKLKTQYPQLDGFSSAENVNPDELKIEYAYSTREAERVGGWRSGVPHPNDDGLWFFIDLHDPDSMRQIHTQPVTVPLCLGEKRVSFLILEGKNTKSIHGAIWKIMSAQGVIQCGR